MIVFTKNAQGQNQRMFSLLCDVAIIVPSHGQSFVLVASLVIAEKLICILLFIFGIFIFKIQVMFF